MSGITWSILILTQARRENKFLGLLDVLLPQAGAAGTVEVLALRNYGGRQQAELGVLRQALLDEARGRWVSFVDDDDMVVPDFVITVLAAIADAPLAEFAAFRIALETGGEDLPVTLTGLGYGCWRNEAGALIRDITHVNPVLAVHARLAGFGAPGTADGSGSGQPSEDKGYANRLRPLLSGCGQADIPRVLYYYRHNPADSVQNGGAPYAPGGPAPVIASPAFRWHPASEGIREAA